MTDDNKERRDRPRYDKGKKDGRPYGKRDSGKGSGTDRKGGDRRSYGKGPRNDRKGPNSDRKGGRGRPSDRKGGKPYDKKNDRGRPYNKDRNEDRSKEKAVEVEQEVPDYRNLRLPTDASRLLYKGIDCQINGNNNLAVIMFVNGSVMMSEGCENNALRILREIGKENFISMRTDISPQCSKDALVEFDYLCMTLKKGYDRSFFDRMYGEGSIQAIYRSICMEEVDGDDPIIDEFASAYPDEDQKVFKGLEFLVRKKDSERAEKHLDRIKDMIELKRSVNVMFTRAMNGDARAVKELKEASKKVPEAAFYSEFLVARAEGDQVEWLRSKYPQYKDLIIARQGEFKIMDTPFGQFLKAKSLESKKEEYMSVMMNAARAGCQEAIDELTTKMFRNDVRRCLAAIYLKENDLEDLIIVYQAGLDDMYYLDQYCGNDRDRILEVGKALGKQSLNKEIDWLKDHYDKGMDFCKDAIVELSRDELYHNKRMIYALHDIGEDMEAAELYFQMEDDPEVPSVKWLKKVCTSDEVLDHIRGHYEEKDDMKTFEFIFAEDDYERRPKKKGLSNRGKGGKRGRR